MKPLFDYVFIKPIEESEKTSSGLFKPAVMNERFKLAEVIEIGEGKYEAGTFIEVGVRKGDKVIYDNNAKFTIKYNEVNYEVVRECHIISSHRD